MGRRSAVDTMDAQESQFVEAVLQGRGASEAYRQAYGGTDNPDSIRSAASRVMRRPAVADAIRAGREAQKADAIASGIWTRRASIQYRIGLLSAIEAETARRYKAMQAYCEAIDADEVLSDAEKAQKKALAMSKPIVGRDTVSAQLSILAALDTLSFTSDGTKGVSWYEVDPEARNSIEARERRAAEWEANEREADAQVARMFGGAFGV